jgi:hypothetical protein
VGWVFVGGTDVSSAGGWVASPIAWVGRTWPDAVGKLQASISVAMDNMDKKTCGFMIFSSYIMPTVENCAFLGSKKRNSQPRWVQINATPELGWFTSSYRVGSLISIGKQSPALRYLSLRSL